MVDSHDSSKEAFIRSTERAFLKQLPDFRSYEGARYDELPFVKEKWNTAGNTFETPPREFSYWEEPDGPELPQDDAFQVGREYAAHLMQFIKDNPLSRTYSLMILTGLSMGATNTPYAWGFLSYIEDVLRMRAQAIEPFEEMAREHENYMDQRDEWMGLMYSIKNDSD